MTGLPNACSSIAGSMLNAELDPASTTIRGAATFSSRNWS